ncbi:hypothetical protein FA95DRAFT_123590 [Auriscalpium vulgare]|uniref:Uncharacterized protein n=1 Tax=Auriscalpium vulgare TaxID=40419 RepID=A0ACB8RMP3_9AGAM|nr:hypothetical protein FA95DRAFT_123590 [Auriscalpium vulgare]
MRLHWICYTMCTAQAWRTKAARCLARPTVSTICIPSQPFSVSIAERGMRLTRADAGCLTLKALQASTIGVCRTSYALNGSAALSLCVVILLRVLIDCDGALLFRGDTGQQDYEAGARVSSLLRILHPMRTYAAQKTASWRMCADIL